MSDRQEEGPPREATDSHEDGETQEHEIDARKGALAQVSSAGKRIGAALEQVADDVSARKALARRAVRIPEQVDVQAIRGKLGMSQVEFAEAFGFSIATLRNWEQHRREPDGAARVLLAVIDRAPEAVQQALAGSKTVERRVGARAAGMARLPGRR